MFGKGFTPDLCVREHARVHVRVCPPIVWVLTVVGGHLSLLSINVLFFDLQSEKEGTGNQKCIRAHTFSAHADTHVRTRMHARTHARLQGLTKAGDVGAAARGRYNAVARPTGNVVINLGPW